MSAISNQAGITLQLNAGQRLTIEQAAGWLADEELPGAFSYPIGFPLNDNNNRFLSHAYRPDHARPDMELPVTVRLEGILYRRCTLSYRVTDGRGDGFLKIDGGEVYDQIRKLNLLDVFSTQLSVGDIGGKTLVQRLGEIVRLPPGQFPFTLFPIRNEAFFETDLAAKLTGFQSQPYMNAWKTGNFVVDTATKGFPIVPQFFLSWVLEQIFARAKYRIIGDWIGRAETQRLTIFNLTALDSPPAGIPGLVIGHRVRPGLCLPNMSVPDFLKAVKQRYGLVFTFNANDQTVSIRRFVDVLKKPTTQDLSKYQLAGYGIDAAANTGFRIAEAVEEADELFKDEQGKTIPAATIIQGKGGQDPISMKIGAPQMIYEKTTLATGAPKWLIPTVRQAGNLLDPLYKDSDRYVDKSAGGIGLRRNDFGLRILSFRGLVPDSAGVLYPLGTSDVRNGRQEIIPGAEGTALAGRTGVYRKSLRPFYYFRDQTRKVNQQLLLPVAVLSNLRYDEPVSLVLDSVRRSYLPDRLQADSAGSSGLVKARLTLYTLPDGIDESTEVDEPMVWVELTVTKAYSEGPMIPVFNVRTFQQELATLTVKVWGNAAKTVPAIVSNLPLTIRQKRTFLPSGEYQPPAYGETLLTFLINGTSQVLDGSFYTLLKRYQNRPLQNPLLVDNYTTVYGLDPGDGYNIILT